MAGTGTLLESGTLEIVEFQIDRKGANGGITQGYYGVNVAKVREIVQAPESFADVPKAHAAIAGVINLRGKIIPVIDLPKWLNVEDATLKCNRIIIAEFNKITAGFLVHSATRIHHVSWEGVEAPTELINHAERECVTGIIRFDNKILMLLDFERVAAEINPGTFFKTRSVKMEGRRKGKTVFIVEDSAFVRQNMTEMLQGAGYRIFTANNGMDALNKLKNVARDSKEKKLPIDRYLNLIITDIEMPQMDGLHLTGKLKEEESLKDVPIIVFSSMANTENIKKWSSIGAVDYISKPDIDVLIRAVDTHLL